MLWYINNQKENWTRSYLSFTKGLKGSGAIWFELHKLPDCFDIYQHCKFNNHSGDIDFIVVGPPGVFIIEVKSHDGKIGFDGNQLTRNEAYFEKDFLYQVRNQYQNLHDYVLTTTCKEIFCII